jgi:hypothetical protein
MYRRGFRFAGLAFLAILGVTAFASVTWAGLTDGGTIGRFVVEGQFTLSTGRTFTGQLEQLTGKATVHFVYAVPALNVALLCTSADVEEGKILSPFEALVKLKLLGCTVVQTNEKGEETEELKSCKPKNGTVIFWLYLLPRLHENELFILTDGDLQNEKGESIIGTLEYGEECALGENVPITGSIVGQVKEGSVEQVTKLFEFSDLITFLFQQRSGGMYVAGDRLRFGANEAFPRGNLTLSLTGSHINKKWSVQ